MAARDGAPKIDDHAIIGDGRSAALVTRDGTIDWLCWPRFDSPSIFAALLDADAGHWRVGPGHATRTHRAYESDSNVLVTTFETASGSARLIDLMAVWSEPAKRHTPTPEHELVRMVEGISGDVEFELDYRPRPDYARQATVLRSTPLGVRLEVGSQLYTLRGDVPLALDDDHVRARFHVRAGERVCFSLAFDTEPATLPPLGSESIVRANAWWQRWASACTYQGLHRDRVLRSALVLKLLSYSASGAIIAAPTTSLPERIGGSLNWDYRFCWLRDASLTMRALLDLGFVDEASAFASWLLHSTRLTLPELCVLYDVHGGLPPREAELAHLAGYRGSRPVRIHNEAAHQLQLDIYGAVIDAVAQLCSRGAELDRETQKLLRELGEYVCEHWHLPDHGIWEPREAPQHHTHSRVLCWVAVDRLLQLHRDGKVSRVNVDRLAAARAAIRAEVERDGYNAALGAYVQTLGGTAVDASTLLLPWYGFVAADAPRMRSTFRRIRQRLGAGRGLVYRYEQSLADGEGAFGICSFWAAEYLARGGGTRAEAERWFEQLLGHANDLGLYAEEIAPLSGDALGNFPQAFTHVGLIGAACSLDHDVAAGATRRVAEGA